MKLNLIPIGRLLEMWRETANASPNSVAEIILRREIERRGQANAVDATPTHKEQAACA